MQIRKSLRASVLDGCAYSAMAGLTQNYITPFALAMKATTTQIGLLAGIQNLMMGLSQFISPRLSERAGSRKKFVLPVVFLHALMWLPILLIPYLFHSQQVIWLMAFLTLGTAFEALSNAPWGSVMADLVREELRGRFFSSRNRITGIVAMAFAFLAGVILQTLTGSIFLGFSVLFAGALVFRLVSLYFLAQMHEPPTVPVAAKQAGMFTIGRHLFSSNVGRFIIYTALINFSATIAGPFFSPYMLVDLKYSYMTYTIVNGASAVSTLGLWTYWGRRIDRAGNIKVLRITSWLIPFVPILWLVSRNVYWIIFVQVFAGFAWSGFELARSIFILDAAPSENRTRYIALFNSLMYTSAFLGSTVGGIIAPHLPRIFGTYYLSVFLLSGVIRLAVAVFFLPHISEVRDVPATSVRQLLVGNIKLSREQLKQSLHLPNRHPDRTGRRRS